VAAVHRNRQRVARVLHPQHDALSAHVDKDTTMPKSKSEPTKKHGDTMEPLIDEASGDGQRGKRDPADDDREQVKDRDDE
jgi:hypothetical protein